MSHILRQWEVLHPLRLDAVSLKRLSLRRYADDSELAQVSLENVGNAHGTSLLAAHRTDVQSVLKMGAEAAGARIELGSLIEDVDFQNTRIKFKRCPDWLQKDVIIAADGIKSTVRKRMLALQGDAKQIRETGDAAWRLLISAEEIYKRKDVDLIDMLESPIAFRWLGPAGHIVCYPVRNHKHLNVVFLHPQKPGTIESWTAKTDKREMIKFYESWNPRIRKFLDYVPDGEIVEWKLHDHDQLVTWIEGNVALMGDAAHPMLPYIAQGAAQAVEDGALLAICLSMVDKTDQINTVLKVYELMRKERAEIFQASAVQLRHTLHLPDGQQQQNRDNRLRSGFEGGPYPDPWSDKSFQGWSWVSLSPSFHIIPIAEYRVRIHSDKFSISGTCLKRSF